MKHASVHSREHHVLVTMLKELRLDAALVQAEVAERLGRPQTYLSAIELGDRGLDLFQVRELVLLYGKDFSAFIQDLENRIATGPAKPPKRRRQPRR